MKRRQVFKVPPTRAEREEVTRSARLPVHVRWEPGSTPEQFHEALGRAGAFEPGSVAFVNYEHEPWCRQVKPQVRYDRRGRPHKGHGECTCKPSLEVVVCPDQESLDVALRELPWGRLAS